jgi:hypothetical protein
MDSDPRDMIRRWRERMYGSSEDILGSLYSLPEIWRPGLMPAEPKKPFLTAADLVMLREMRIRL